MELACPTTVNETVCIAAAVDIRPQVTVGDIHTFCSGDPFFGTCPGVPVDHCSFVVSQRICVQVPLLFHASAEVTPTGIVCGTPAFGGCPATAACTNSVGTWRNVMDAANALITAAGGSIVLGSNSDGLSFTVTTANSMDVLSFNTPEPPAPASPPFAGQYQQLYAQLLAAKLNVLNGATCGYAESSIALADDFLATSPAGGMAGAPNFSSLLELYNTGNGPGCPVHCSLQ